MKEELIAKTHRGVLYVVSAPAGTGKTTLVNRLIEEFSFVVRSVSCTTRKPREGELNGRDYYFLEQTVFEQRKAAGDFLESVELFGNVYGTSRSWVEERLSRGQHVVLVIDTQGKEKLEKAGEEIVSIFIAPPSLKALRQRLVGRKTDTKESIEKRLEVAEREIALCDHYDYLIVNDEIEEAYCALKSIVVAENHRIQRD